MDYRSKTILETTISVDGFGKKPGLVSNPRSISLFAQVGTLKTTLEGLSTDQVSGGAEFGTGVQRKRELAAGMLDLLRDLNRTAKGLDTETHPDAAPQFRMPRSKTYVALLAAGRSFQEHAAPLKAAFVESGMAADFDVTLGDLIDELTAAIQRRSGGRAEQVRGTAGLEGVGREAARVVRKLDATMRNLLKGNPHLLEEWKSASHIQRAPKRTPSAAPAPGGVPAPATPAAS
jgi:hypothetical protein